MYRIKIFTEIRIDISFKLSSNGDNLHELSNPVGDNLNEMSNPDFWEKI